MHSNTRHLRFADYPQVSWKNGRGVTREIAASPDLDGGSPSWRVSMATISEQAVFSLFPGLDRSLAVVDGAGIELTIDGAAKTLRVGDEPARFAGDNPASARPIDGPTLDLNLMVDPLRATGSMTAALAGEHELTGGPWLVVALVNGLEVHAVDEEPLIANRLDTVTFGAREHGTLTLAPHSEHPVAQVVAYVVRVSATQ